MCDAASKHQRHSISETVDSHGNLKEPESPEEASAQMAGYWSSPSAASSARLAGADIQGVASCPAASSGEYSSEAQPVAAEV